MCLLCKWLESLDKVDFDFKSDLLTETTCVYFYRNFELAKLQYKHTIENTCTEDGYNFSHLLVTLENQKGWQAKLSKEVDLWGQFSFHEKCNIS